MKELRIFWRKFREVSYVDFRDINEKYMYFSYSQLHKSYIQI